jgi:CheY-like chemotaxis protein
MPINVGAMNEAAAEVASSQMFRILFVDDVTMCRKLPIRILGPHLSEYEEACDGLEALLRVQASINTGKLFDAILMDNSMPNMNGTEAAKEIRKLGFAGKIIGVTGNALQADVDEFISNGADDVVIKPITKENYAHILAYIQ